MPQQSFAEAYKTWRNQARKYSLASLLEHCLNTLQNPPADPIEAGRAAPWQTCLLVKWACQD